MKLNKLGASILLAAFVTGSSFAMEMMASGTVMKDDMMKASSTMMMDHKMDDKMMKKDMMMKCLDVKKATRMEIKKFQKENGIISTGFIGKLTKAKLAKMNCGQMMKEMKDTMHATGTMMDHKMDDKMMKASDTMMIKTN